MRNLALYLMCVLLSDVVTSAQTWGCAERDYKCQMDAVSKALNKDPKNPENYYNMGLVFQRSGADKEAIEAFSMYIAIPGLKAEHVADGYNNRGISQRHINRPDLAIADYTKAIELNPTKSSQFLVNRANASVDLKKFDQAFKDYDQAIAVDPKYAPSYAQRGVLYAAQSRIEDALKDFGRSIEIDPSFSEPYYNRGTIYFERKEYEKAIPDFSKYISLINDPSYLADAYTNRGISYYYTHNLQKAIDDLSRTIELQPDRPNGYRARAMLYRELKKPELAALDEKRAKELSLGSK